MAAFWILALLPLAVASVLAENVAFKGKSMNSLAANFLSLQPSSL
jgi:hypothetical protein